MSLPAKTPPDRASPVAKLARCMLVLLPFMVACSPESYIGSSVQVMDAASSAPIKGAVVMVPDGIAQTDDKGMVLLSRPASHLWVRAQGHGRVELDNVGKNKANIVVRLPAVTPKALYLSVYGVGNEHLRGNALKLLNETELNALVIDVKGDRGYIPYRSTVALAAKVGAQKVITVHDMPGLIASLRAQDIYTVARVVTFKDDPLARSHPEWAVHTRNGDLWHDREGLAWSDPFRHGGLELRHRHCRRSGAPGFRRDTVRLRAFSRRIGDRVLKGTHPRKPGWLRSPASCLQPQDDSNPTMSLCPQTYLATSSGTRTTPA